MISRLNNSDPEIATKMQTVFCASYSVEAIILQAKDFPPLKRTLEEYMKTETAFFGRWNNDSLVGIVEIREYDSTTHIQSLVVDPQYFRQGMAFQLMTFVVENFNSKIMFVETGINNFPAIQLYEKFGFQQTNQWDTECGIRKVRLEKFPT